MSAKFQALLTLPSPLHWSEAKSGSRLPGVAARAPTLPFVAGEQRGGRQRIPRPDGFRVGGPPPWARVDPAERRLSLDDVRRRLLRSPPGARAVSLVPDSVSAAVLVPLVEIGGETHVMFIKRPETMSTHKGEIAFPGGKFDPAVDADLPRHRTARGPGGDRSRSGGRGDRGPPQRGGDGRVPVHDHAVRRLPGGPARARAPSPAEVVRVLEVPLSELLDDSIYHEERWDGFQRDMSVYFFDLADETVWGATARILTDLLTRLVSGA